MVESADAVNTFEQLPVGAAFRFVGSGYPYLYVKESEKEARANGAVWEMAPSAKVRLVDTQHRDWKTVNLCRLVGQGYWSLQDGRTGAELHRIDSYDLLPPLHEARSLLTKDGWQNVTYGDSPVENTMGNVWELQGIRPDGYLQ